MRRSSGKCRKLLFAGCWNGITITTPVPPINRWTSCGFAVRKKTVIIISLRWMGNRSACSASPTSRMEVVSAFPRCSFFRSFRAGAMRRKRFDKLRKSMVSGAGSWIRFYRRNAWSISMRKWDIGRRENGGRESPDDIGVLSETLACLHEYEKEKPSDFMIEIGRLFAYTRHG